MNILISGGCKNGKSLHAQELARDMAHAGDRSLYYIATMIPRDQEDRDRIARHLAAREGWGFTTLEQPLDLTALLSRPDVDRSGAFLMDSVTALLSNEMFREGGVYDPEAGARVAEDLVRFAQETGNTVFVSDYIYADAGQYDEWTENYRRWLALCDRALAQVCDQVLEASFGVFRRWK
jgi:adenosylcobinamide kinase/adenosylcobinamide-phosphate guanylyltransferase